MKRYYTALLFVILLVFGGYYAASMTINDTKTAYKNGDLVYYAPQSVYDYLAWKRPDMPGAPFNANTRIPRGTISQMTNNPRVVDGELVDDWTVSVSGTTMQLNRFYGSKAAFKTALKNALLAKVDEATVIAARDAAYAESVDEIGLPAQLGLDVYAINFGDTDTEKTFDITNSGDFILNWTITTSSLKVTVDPDFGDTLGEMDIVTITVDRNGMPPGIYDPSVDIMSDGGNATIILNVVVGE